MVGARCRNARGDHVAVADRLDLLEPVPLRQLVEMTEQVIEEADDLGGRSRSDQGVKSTTSANRIEAESNWSAIGWVCGLQPLGDRARQDVEQEVFGLGLLRRSAASASPRWRANTASSVNTMVPPTAILRASIVLVNQPGAAAGSGR